MHNMDFIYMQTSEIASDWLKGIVSRDFKGLQMVSMDRAQVPNSPAACLFFI
jgi:hypothetical protein